MKIVRLTNFWTPTSGGQRTALEEVGRRYRERGHEVVLVVPGRADTDTVGPAGRLVTLRSPRLRGTSYRLLTDLDRVRARLAVLAPDRIELSDRSTLFPVGRWAQERAVPLLLWAHERLDAVLAPRLPRGFPLAAAAGAWNRRTLRSVSMAVAPSAFVADELRSAGVPDVRIVPHGVDLATFHPRRRPPVTERGPRLIWVGRLSVEKRPDLAISTLAELVARGRSARLLVVGDGPERDRLQHQAGDLPVTFTGHVAARDALAHLLAGADVALATCPCESFGLAALEALASGTAVVASAEGGLREVVDRRGGRTAVSRPDALADAVDDLLAVPTEIRTDLARRRAEHFSWESTVDGLLAAHGVDVESPILEVPA